MSVRTIVEFNHDYAHEIERREGLFVEMLGIALSSGSAEDWDMLRLRFGITLATSCHHSDIRKVVVNDHDYELG